MKFQDPSIWTNQDLMGAKGSTLPFSTGHRFPHLFGQWRPQTDGDRSHERFQEITEKTYQKTQPTKKPHKIPGSWQRPSCLLHFWLICWCTPPEIEHIDTVRTKNGHISKESTFSKPSTTHAKPLHPTPATLVGQGTEIFQGPSSWVSSCWFSGMQSRSRWWFNICFIFNPIWGRFPIWLIFFRWVETTNQRCFLPVVGMSKVFFLYFSSRLRPWILEILPQKVGGEVRIRGNFLWKYTLGCTPQKNSGKWRFRLGSPIRNIKSRSWLLTSITGRVVSKHFI